MNIVRTSAPGKLNLIGEHAVVYGKPALIAAINKRCFVTIKQRSDNQIIISSKNFDEKITTDIDGILKKFYKAQDDWGLFIKNNDVEILKKITSSSFDYVQIIIGQFLDYYNNTMLNNCHAEFISASEKDYGIDRQNKILKQVQDDNRYLSVSFNGFDLEIDSEIPVGAGMGSSAALAVSIIGALNLFTNKKLDKDAISNIAFFCEQKRHGRPSGGDNSASSFGGLIRFKKGEGVEMLDLKLSAKIEGNFYVVNTGSPVESTGEMVSSVRNIYNQKPALVDKIFADQERMTGELIDVLKASDEAEIMRIINSAESNLERIGVVSERVRKLIGEIEKSGGSAKICGAGGRADKSGIILVYHKNLQALEDVLESYELEAEHLKLDYSGLRVE